MVCFLAFLLEAALLRKLREKGEEVGFGELMVDLGEFRAVELEVNGKRYLVRTELEGVSTAKNFDPPTVNKIDPPGHS